MHSSNNIRLVSSSIVSEGAGLIVRRSMGSSAIRGLDPFVMLDFF